MRRIIRTTAFVFAAACTSKAPEAADTQKSASAPAPVSTTTATGDSLRGTVAVRGKDSIPDLVLQSGADTVLLRSADLETLRRVIGIEVVVRGARTGGIFEVANFVVRALNGERATDGVLDVENGVFFVRTEDGSRANISTIPGPLRGEIGSRVYLVGSLNQMPSAFGIISEAR